MINIKTAKELEKMKVAASISARALELAGSMCVAGVSCYSIDEAVRRYIFSENAVPSFLNYNGYPKSCCISINDMVIHGIPSRSVVLKDGDIVSVDVGAKYEGYNGDNAYTFVVGSVPEDVGLFLDTAKGALFAGIVNAVRGKRVGDISFAVQEFVKRRRYGIVREFVGHGVGKELHEEPEVPNFLDNVNVKGPRLLPGMVIAIEPMISMGDGEVVRCADDWGVRTRDGSLAAHFEHTVLITDSEPVILTKL